MPAIDFAGRTLDEVEKLFREVQRTDAALCLRRAEEVYADINQRIRASQQAVERSRVLLEKPTYTWPAKGELKPVPTEAQSRVH